MSQPSGISNRMKGSRRIIINVFLSALGVLSIVFMLKYSDISAKMIADNIGNTKWHYLIGVVLTTFGTVLLTGQKWKIILGDLANMKAVGKGYFLYYSALGLVSNSVVPYIGNYGLKTVSLKLLHDVPVNNGALSILIEQLFDLLILILLLLPSLLFFLNVMSLEASLIVTLAIFLSSFVVLTHNRKVIFGVMTRGYGFLYQVASRISLIRHRLSENPAALAKCGVFSETTAIKLFLYSCLRELCLVLRVYFVMSNSHIDIPFFAILLGTALIQAIMLVIVVPAALGVLEGGWFGVLTVLGIDKAAAGIFIVSLRILGETSLLLVTLVSYLYYMANRRKE